MLFDNFVMISDEELTAAVRRRIPTFDGTAPVMPGIAESFEDALKAILVEHGIAGEIEYRAGLPGIHFTEADVTHVFRLNAAGLQTCAARVDGVSPPFQTTVDVIRRRPRG